MEIEFKIHTVTYQIFSLVNIADQNAVVIKRSYTKPGDLALKSALYKSQLWLRIWC